MRSYRCLAAVAAVAVLSASAAIPPLSAELVSAAPPSAAPPSASRPPAGRPSQWTSAGTIRFGALPERRAAPPARHASPTRPAPPSVRSGASPAPFRVPSMPSTSVPSPISAATSPRSSAAAPSSGTVAQTTQTTTSTPDTVAPARTFAGLAQADDISAGIGSVEPPDPWIAAGPTDLVQAVNSLIRVTDRTGTSLAQSTADAFFGVLPNQQVSSDPHVAYDPGQGRWLGTYMSYDCTNGYLYLAVSQTVDPTGSWDRWYFTFPGSIPDYPGIGSSSDKIVISANEFGIDASAPGCASAQASPGSSLVVTDWSSVLGGTPPGATYFGPDPTRWTWRPARNLTADPTIYLVGEGGPTGDVIYDTITGTVGAGTVTLTPAVDLTASASLAPFGSVMPPAPRQPGTPVTIADAVNERPTDALWQNGSLWFTTTFGCVPAGDTAVRDCARVSQVATAGSPAVRQDIAIAHTGFDSFMPGIGLSGSGTAYVVYSASSTTQSASTWANAQLASDPPGTLGPTTSLASGAATYGGMRWGDYVGVALDPSDAGAVWTADEYADTTGRWATSVSLLTTGLVTRLAGGTRFGTAAAISSATFPAGPDVAYIAYANNFPDALAGAAAAGTIRGPILLAGTNLPLDPSTVKELGRLQPKRIVVLGGTGVISDAVLAALGQYTTGGVTRLAGGTRFGTAAAISAATFPAGPDVAYIAYANNFPDALAGAAAAGTIRGPILLAGTNLPLDPSTVKELGRLQPKRIVVLGGTGVISDAVLAALGQYTTP